MKLTVRMITEKMLFNSITVRLNHMTKEAFLSSLLNYFLDGLSAIIPCSRDDIFLFGIENDIINDNYKRNVLNVSLSVRRPDISLNEFYTSQYLQEKVYLNRAILARLASVQVLPFDDNLCVREPCLNFEQCLTVLKFGNATDFIASDTFLFRSITPITTFACRCPKGFAGSKESYLCDTELNLCYSDPCLNGGVCNFYSLTFKQIFQKFVNHRYVIELKGDTNANVQQVLVESNATLVLKKRTNNRYVYRRSIN